MIRLSAASPIPLGVHKINKSLFLSAACSQSTMVRSFGFICAWDRNRPGGEDVFVCTSIRQQRQLLRNEMPSVQGGDRSHGVFLPLSPSVADL